MMTLNKNYFNFLNKSNNNFNYIILVFSLMLMPLLSLVASGEVLKFNIALVFYLVITIILSIFTLLYNFRFLYSKRSLDTYYQLPLTKQELIVTTFIFSLYQTLVLPTLMFLMANLIYLIKGVDLETHLIAIILITIVLITFSQIINLGIILIANTLMDAIIMLAAYLGLLLFIIPGFFYYSELSIITGGYLNSVFNGFSPYWYLVKLVILISRHSFREIICFKEIIGFLVILICLLLAIYSIIKNGFLRNGEKAEQISSAIYGYPFISVIYAFILITIIIDSSSINETIMAVLLVFIPYVAAYQIYRRRIGMSMRALITFVIIVGLALFYQLVVIVYLRDEVFNQFPEKYPVEKITSAVVCSSFDESNIYVNNDVDEELYKEILNIESRVDRNSSQVCNLNVNFSDHKNYKFPISKEEFEEIAASYKLERRGENE